MKKKKYVIPNVQVLHVTPCTILATSFIDKGEDGKEEPQPDEDNWYWGE